VANGSVAPSSGDLVGRVLGGRYRLTRPLGRGASARVFAAEDVVLRRRVAVKILHPALASDEAFLRRFQTEAQIAAALRHPNVLAVHDWGDDGGSPFLVTELLEGGSLKSLIDGGFRATPSQALRLGLEACRGLDHAHRRGLVHRDVKPANLLFDDEGHLRVADFGLARAIAEGAVTEPLGAVMGTARYASPEQAEGRPLDGRSDVYSLALVLVEAITGEVPFAADTSAATLLARLERPLQPPSDVGPLAEALAAAGCLDRDGRSDAARFGRMLKRAATKLDRPEPLPLVGPRPAAGVDPSSEALTDNLQAVRAAGLRPERPRRAGEPGPERRLRAGEPGFEPPFDASADEGDDYREVTGAQGEAGAVEPARRGRRRRRLMLLLIPLMLLVAGLAAAAAVVQPWRPTVDVPQVVGLSREEATARLRPDDLGLRVTGRTASEVVEVDRVLTARPARQRKGRSVSVTLSAGPEERTLPAVAGRPAEDVVRAITAVGLVVTQSAIDSDTVAIGTVLTIDPPAGTQVPRGATVTIGVSAGPAALPIPDVSGKSADEALAALGAAGLKGTSVEVFDAKVPAGKVVGTNPAPGISVRPGLAVAVNVSKGPDLVVVPTVSGRSPQSAQQTLSAAGLVASTTYGPPGGQVFSSQPAAGARVRRGSSVALYTK